MEGSTRPGYRIRVLRVVGREGKRWGDHDRMVKNGDDWKIGGVGVKEGPSSI